MKPLILIRGVGLTAALTLSHTVAAFAASGAENTPLRLGSGTSTSHSSGSSSSSLVRTIVGLFIVIAVIYGISWILRQTKGGGKSRASGNGLAPVASLPLGAGRSVALVRVGHELVLLGVAEHGVTAIRTYTEQEAFDNGLDLDGDEDDDFDPVTPPMARVVEAFRRFTVRT